MALEAGTKLGPYEIVSAIGAGGMGEVYKATDTRLNRTVAVKILPAHVSEREDMKARFEREAQTIAGLNHPNICTLHDVGEGSVPASEPGLPPTNVSFLVLEFIEGETLADRLQRGAMPLGDALKVGIEIADALDKAHKQGVIHRDLKPANVMLTKHGTKLLDFGLAKWTGGEAESLAAMATRADVTAKGTMLGTLQYMAPEQIEGREADKRTDIFAFGVLLYEMITRRRAFEGKSQATLISAIMSREPRPMGELVPVSPPTLEHVVERCVQKDPEERWQTAHSLVLQLRWIAYGGAENGIAAPISPAELQRQRMMKIALAAAAALVVALAVPAVLSFGGAEAGEPFAYRVPVRGFQDMAVAPDGSGFVFVASPSVGSGDLYYRPLGALTAVKLDGTADAAQPFWSPDSEFVGFVAGGTLKKIDVTGGPAQNLAQVDGFAGGTWNAAGTILFGSSKGLLRVSAEGGTPEPVTAVEAPETGHYWPHFLPDGEHYVFLIWSDDATSRALFTGALGSTDRQQLLAVESNAAYAEPGYLLYHREAAVYAQPFDAGSLAFTGDPVRVAGSATYGANGRGAFDVSQTGVLLYHEGSTTTTSGRGENPAGAFTWVTLSGNRIAPAGETGPYGDIDLSPDGRQIAATRTDGGSGDIWVIDWERGDQGVATQLTLDPANDINPVWSNDGKRVAFTTLRNGNADVFIKNANGVGNEEPLMSLSSPNDESIEDWSKDGKYVAYLYGKGGQTDIWALPLSGDKEPFPVVEGTFTKDEPQFSPNGRWLAYTSDESTEFEVYIRSFPDGGQRQKASEGGGGQPRWSPDGRELYYRNPSTGAAMAVDVTTDAALVVSSPRTQFASAMYGGFQTGYLRPTRHQWDVSPDGQRFLVRAPHPTGGGGRGNTGVPSATTDLVPAGAAAGGQTAGGFRGTPPNQGLTVVLDWLAAVRAGGGK